MSISPLDPEAYLKERVDDQIKWMSQKAKDNKSSYRTSRLLQMSLGILVSAGGSFATSVDFGPLILTLVGASISLAGAWETVNDYQNNWIRYRRTKEELERERMLYRTSSGPYQSSSAESEDAAASFQLFVSRVEAILSQEVDQWSTSVSRTTANAPNSINQ